MTIIIKDLGLTEYNDIYQKMVDYTMSRNELSDDQIWLLEHKPVYTLGLAGDRQHILDNQSIPVIETDRGGQVTYHGPGQLIAYLLIDLNRRPYAIKKLVNLIESTMIETLLSLNIDSARTQGAPGVYVNGDKIAALGIRVKKGCSYHGLALNVNMDMTPFIGINPCGYSELKCCQVSDFIPAINMQNVKQKLINILLQHLDVEHKQMNYVA
ncbi:MAG: lipoyl(octanoyl) transferase LipB [Pseudomonadota bacterium]